MAGQHGPRTLVLLGTILLVATGAAAVKKGKPNGCAIYYNGKRGDKHLKGCDLTGCDPYRQCTIVFPPQPYCTCLGSPAQISCVIDVATNNVVGLWWGGTSDKFGSWMQGSYDERHKNNTIYVPPSDGDVTSPLGYNTMCLQPYMLKDPSQVMLVNITFPYQISGGPQDASANRINKLFARVDEYTGYISQLTFQFQGVDPTTQANYYSQCGAGDTYTRSVVWNAKPNVTEPSYESVLCGLRSPCEKTTNYLQMPLLPCWSEEVQDVWRDPANFPVTTTIASARAAAAAASAAQARSAAAAAAKAGEQEAAADAESAAEDAEEEAAQATADAAAAAERERAARAAAAANGTVQSSPPPPALKTAEGLPADVTSAAAEAQLMAVKAAAARPAEVACENGAADAAPTTYFTTNVILDRWADMPAQDWSPAKARVVSRIRAARRRRASLAPAAAAAPVPAAGPGPLRRLLQALGGAGGDAPVPRFDLSALDNGWDGLPPQELATSTQAGGGAASSGASGAPLGVAFAAGQATNLTGFALHAGGGAVVVTSLDAATGRPAGASAPRLLAAIFAAELLNLGNQTDYYDPDAIFDKESRRFVLACASHGDGSAAAAGGGGSSAAAPAPAPAVLWVAASASPDPRRSWRVAALRAPAAGDVGNPCGPGLQAVWEAPRLGYDSFGLHVTASLACAPPGAGSSAAAADARTNRRAWLVSFSKVALYEPAPSPRAPLVAAAFDLSALNPAVRAAAPAAPQAAADANVTSAGAAFAVALEATPGAAPSRLAFYAVINTSRLRGMTPGAPAASAPALCHAARTRDTPSPYAEPEPLTRGEMSQPGKGDDWALDAGRSWRVYSAALSEGKIWVASKAYGPACAAAGGPACRPAAHVSAWTPLGGGGGGGGGAAAPGALAPAAAGPAALISDESAAVAFPSVVVPPGGRPVVGFSFTGGQDAGAGAGFAGVAFSRLTPAGAVSGAPLRAARLGAAAVDAPAAAGGYRLWGDRTAADVMGSNVYVAAPYAAAGGWGTRVALLPQP